jgi:hypothetical protein
VLSDRHRFNGVTFESPRFARCPRFIDGLPGTANSTVFVTLDGSRWQGWLWHLEFFVLRLISLKRFLIAFERGFSTITQLAVTFVVLWHSLVVV